MSGRRVAGLVVFVLVTAGCASAGGGVGEVSSTPASTGLPTTIRVATTSTVPGDPSLAGVHGVVRITRGVAELEEEWGLLDPEGAYIGPVDVNGKPLLLEPIEGYGDFSDMTLQERFDMDPKVRQRLVLRCVSDVDPRFAQLIADTGDFNWGNLPGRLSQVGMAVYIACDEGLHLPSLRQKDWTPAMWQKAYEYALADLDCIERQTGIDLGPRLTLDEFIAGVELLPPDSPYWKLDTATVRRLDQVCPWGPVGGFGAWDPGDPITPAP
ncbi:MAG TPA: hypothetical protein ENH00_01100 [Actinobacteria bacterium]|nr:hypothetical protein BMS3Bbin01_02327 [bacterium BMS3Bbin01]HDH24775.1 hypothetical protein [Actinomycetota bacterium]